MQNTNLGSNCIGNVIRIIDNRTILVNAGSNLLHVDDFIQIYELGPEIKDCDGTILGNYEFIKDKLKVIETNDSYSLCQKQEYREYENASTISQLVLSPLFNDKKTIEYIPLNVLDKDIQPLKINDPVIHVGDPIKRT